MLNGKIDNKNIGLLKNIYWLRQELDVYCLICANQDSIYKRGVGRSFFLRLLRKTCVDLIALSICKIYEYEKNYELNSIEGLLKNLVDEQSPVSDSSRIDDFVNKYGYSPNEGESLSALTSTIACFKQKYQKELDRFKTIRDKKIAHSEYGSNVDSVPSYDVMKHLFNFGSDFYMLISRAIVSTASVSVVPCDLNYDRKVKVGLKRVLHELGLTDIKSEME